MVGLAVPGEDPMRFGGGPVESQAGAGPDVLAGPFPARAAALQRHSAWARVRDERAGTGGPGGFGCMRLTMITWPKRSGWISEHRAPGGLTAFARGRR